MSAADSNNDQVTYRQLLDYFATRGDASPALIPHPDESVNRLALENVSSLRRAAVLIPITRSGSNKSSDVILTVRSANLKSHAGQISLPGGTRELGDADAFATALRESEEEIGLPAERVEILGRLGDMALPSGFLITPIVGLIEHGQQFIPCPIEVADIFQAPLELVLNPQAYRSSDMMFGAQSRKILELLFEDYRIWGATAAILHHLAQEVAAHSSDAR